MLKTQYESKDQIPEGAEQFFEEKDGKFVLQAEGMKTAEDVDKVSEALNKERTQRREAEKKAQEFESKFSKLPEDFDVDEYNRLKDSGGGDVDAKLKEQRERLKEQHEKDLQKLQSQIEEKDNLVTTHVKDATLKSAMAEANIAKPYAPAVEAMFKDKVVVEGGDVFLNEKPVSEALKEWASTDDGKYYVSAPSNSGGGSETAKPGAQGGKTINRADFDSMGHQDRAAAVRDGAKIVE